MTDGQRGLMSSSTTEFDAGDRPAQRSSPGEAARQAFVRGLALTVPVIVTLIVLTFALNFVASLMAPVVDAANYVWPNLNVPAAVVQLVAVVTLLVIIFAVGIVAERTSGDHFADEFDNFMASIPGLGSVYTSFSEMSDLLLDSDTDSFREVKLVEYPTDNSYAIAFLTADTPDVINDATTHEEMQTLFMPMAPNPVMGGFVIHVDEDQVYDVDLTVEEGIRSIVTSGVAIGQEEAHAAGVSEGELRELGAYERVEGVVGPATDRRESDDQSAERSDGRS